MASDAKLKTVYEFWERLNVLWTGVHTSNEALLQHFKHRIADAEASDLDVLRDYARTMRGAALAQR